MKGAWTRSSRRGFTLIELLVVIAIIGILASIVLASLSGAKARGRDAKRVSDIKQLQLALELYYDANQNFPAASPITVGNTTLTAAGYISVVPLDPSNQAAYHYVAYALTATPGTCVSYHLGASLEQSNTATQQDNDISAPPAGYTYCTGGASSDFSGADNAVCASGDTGTAACFDVKP